MSPALGILFALIALFAWGFGDFLIQRTTRLVGDWKALFYITFVGFVGLFPFVNDQIPLLTRPEILLLSLTGLISFAGALGEFEALKRGKIAVIEPIMGLELPTIVLLSILFVNESASVGHLGIIAIIFIGILLATTKRRVQRHHARLLFEKGTIIGILGATAIGISAVLIGISSKTLSPLLIIWFTDAMIMVLTALYLMRQGAFRNFLKDLRAHPVPILGQSIFDNLAWVAFGFSTSIIPISTTSAISESYIALTVLLGIFVNREKIRPHQIIGILFAIVGVILLSTMA